MDLVAADLGIEPGSGEADDERGLQFPGVVGRSDQSISDRKASPTVSAFGFK